MLSIMSVNCIGYVYLMPIVGWEFSFLLHKYKLNIFLLIYGCLYRYICKYWESLEGRNALHCSTATPLLKGLCSLSEP